MSTLLQDIRYGFRMLVKHKGFSLIAIAVLAIGIGANTAIFSLVNGILLRPLSYPEADRIVSFEARNPAQGITQSNVSFPDFVDWSKQSDLFAESAGFWSGNGNFGGDGVEPERVPRTHVTTDFFSVLGVQPMLGRT